MFSRKTRTKKKRMAEAPSGRFPVVPLTLEHVDILREINSPWFSVHDPGNSGIPRREALRNALKSATSAQVAEFIFLISRPAAESRAVLEHGRSQFAQAASDYCATVICREGLDQILSNDAALVIGRIPVTGGSRLTRH